jgi:hypothetical protein
MAFAGVIAGLHLLVMATACVMCYVSRSIPTQFSGKKPVLLSSLVGCFVLTRYCWLRPVNTMKRENTFPLR